MTVKLEINGQSITVRAGATIMEAAQELDIYVPHFCYHEKLSIAANCRMCMVDVEKAPKAVPACATPVADGMVVRTDSERAKKAQNGVMEFLLINHPLDCPICDQGGECQLQDLAVGYGVSNSRYTEEKRVVFEKNLGPLISTDMTRCIHCTRCVRFGREVAGIMELGMTGRGEHAEIMPFIERTVDSELSGNMIDLCPVGALTSKPFRYSARSWELRRHPSVGTHDAWGSHLTVQVKDNIVKRVLPLRAPEIHEHWISDRDRFSYEGLNAPDRALKPMARPQDVNTQTEVPWQDAISATAKRLREICDQHGPEHIGFFVSPRASSEEALLMQRIANHLGCKNIDSRLLQRHFDGDDVCGFGAPISDITSAKNILFIGAEPARELPLLTAMLRQKHGKKKYNIFSIAASDISAQLPMKMQLTVAPSNFSYAIEQLLLSLGGKAPNGYHSAGEDLFDSATKATAPVKQFAKQFASGKTVILLGDSARTATDYGVIVALARQLADKLGGTIGTIADGGNSIGVRNAGALPPDGGMHTAAMLRANLRAAVMLRCEKGDFAEPALANNMLKNADFTCAFSSFVSGFMHEIDVLLPTAEYTETDGSYTNGNDETTQTTAAVTPPGKARPAWKILRLLGEYLSVPGFDFNDLTPVRTALAEQQQNTTAPLPIAQPPRSADETLCLYGGAAAYGSDALVRRSPALQKTRQGKAAQMAYIHPDDMGDIAEHSRIVIRDADGNEEETTLAADATLARGVLRFYPKRLTAVNALTIHAIAEEKTA